MRGVTIGDVDPERGCLRFDLIDILNLIPDAVVKSQWRLFQLECTGESAQVLATISDAGDSIDGEALWNLVKKLDQVIDGVLEGYFPGENAPWIRIRAVDSTAFDVESREENVLDLIRQKFENVTSYPPSS
jgi:hypothetical protein